MADRSCGGERPGGAPRRPARRALVVLALALFAGAWAWAAHALWHSTVPAGLPVEHIRASRLFSSSFLRRSASYEEFLDVERLLAGVTLLVVLALYARYGHRLMRESAAGRIGTGMMLGMLGFAIVWLAEVPFGLVAVWWERRHGVSHQGYVSSLIESFVALGGQFLFISLALLVAMGLAGLLRRWWWALAAPVFVGLALLSTFLGFYLIPDTRPLRDPNLLADARALARSEGVPATKVAVQDVHRFTTAPNAESVGFGSTRRVILWDTLLDGRFSRDQIRAVIAHELGHLAHHHPLKRVGWLALFLIPAAALVAYFTRGRGGLARAEAVPLALFVFVALQLLTLPLWNMVSRHEEAEADWSALQATHEPAAARSLFERLAVTSLADPDPPAWSYVLYGDHPTIAQRVAMVEAWRVRSSR
ncbi:MAG TPA: M48 family metalloprotease [Solirubrobacteraceae bacterium]|nr:M48 family metalloprotease [Solirubrobacteraceae bacterium]